jgi:hypothetical protein
MTKTQSSIYIQRLSKREPLENRISRMHRACQICRKRFEEGDFTFEELRRACRSLSTLISSFDRDAGDLCLLASHAENGEQFTPICKLSRQHWELSEDEEEGVDGYVLSRARDERNNSMNER